MRPSFGIAKQVGEGLIDLPAGSGAGAFVEIAVQRGIELKEVESLHVEPLVDEAGDEFIRTRDRRSGDRPAGAESSARAVCSASASSSSS